MDVLVPLSVKLEYTNLKTIFSAYGQSRSQDRVCFLSRAGDREQDSKEVMLDRPRAGGLGLMRLVCGAAAETCVTVKDGHYRCLGQTPGPPLRRLQSRIAGKPETSFAFGQIKPTSTPTA
jgi:hypothetical protein